MNVRDGVNTLIINEFIFNLNSKFFETKSFQIKGWFKLWILDISNFIEIHKVKADASAFNNNQNTWIRFNTHYFTIGNKVSIYGLINNPSLTHWDSWWQSKKLLSPIANGNYILILQHFWNRMTRDVNCVIIRDFCILVGSLTIIQESFHSCFSFPNFFVQVIVFCNDI
jgi:hypothetical protein